MSPVNIILTAKYLFIHFNLIFLSTLRKVGPPLGQSKTLKIVFRFCRSQTKLTSYKLLQSIYKQF